MSMRIIATWRHFFRAIATARCNQSKFSLSLEKMSKSSEKVKKKYADTYKWTDDEVELLLTVNNLKTSCQSLKYWLCKFITAAFI